ncbi:MFS transporter [Croceicoccus sp. BE223]|uniref:MFS transporter n=1 Tax=Croceicoccus sp. BE223 TaxID=2817716 RepID=UPI002861061E|nr:MFS transporter [Croceicoccus sp. BE223]MDR7103730.1 MFS family permease [Croceicoccus sp. BE223]
MHATHPGEWRLNWRLVAAGAVGMFVTTVPPASIGVFIEPLERDFGWSRTAITSAAAMTMIVAAFFSPPLGRAIDRYGARMLGFIGMLITPLVFAAVALVTSDVWMYLAIWFVMSLAITLGGGQPWTTAVSRGFVKDRGLALGLTIAGASIAGAATPPTAAWLVENFGWRSAHAIMGIACFIVFVPICLVLIRHKAVPLAMTEQSGADGKPAELSGMTPQRALRSPLFWQMQIGLVLGCLIVNGIAVNLIPMLTSRGMTTIEAASAMGLLGVGAFIGKFIVGWLMDRFYPPVVVGVTRLLGAVAALLLFFSGDAIGTGEAYLVAFIAGTAVGGEIPITAFLSARAFGMAHFASLYAWTFAANRLASGLGPMLLAFLYDLRGDYQMALIASTVLLVASALLIFTLDAFASRERRLVEAPAHGT